MISKPTKAPTASLASVYKAVERLMLTYSPPFRTDISCVTRGKKSLQLTVPKPVAVPGAYGGKPTKLMMSGLILQKDFVGFYLMCIYMNDAVKKKLSPRLLKLLKGKTCFHLKCIDDDLLRDIRHALNLSVSVFRQKDWA
jgi:hypothetical protein